MTAPFVAQAHITTPFGPMLLRRSALGLTEVNFANGRWPPKPLPLPDEPEHPWFVQTREVLARWPSLQADPELPPLDPHGTPFQRAVWNLLRHIPRGTSTHYGALAQQLGDRNKSRAVGAAVGRNPIGILIPCHRVLGRDGALTGFGGGLPLKRALLAAEGVAWKG